MLTGTFFILYNFIFIPLAFFITHLIALFHPKIRKGLFGRAKIYHKLSEYEANFKNFPILVIHCASMGEFEHIKPFILEFKNIEPNFRIVVLFFSPSGYQHVTSFPAVDLILYSPFDWFFPVWRFMRRLKPRLWIIAKHDVWPNQVWIARFLGIPLFLINASLHRQSNRLSWFSLPFHRSVYKHFTGILTISNTDRHYFGRLTDKEKLVVAGDTKYDQVIYRREESLKKTIIPNKVVNNRWIWVVGSSWPEDHFHLNPVIRSFCEQHENFLTIICPHEPTGHHINQLNEQLSNLSLILLSDIDQYAGQSVIIVDRVGVLANIYHLAKVAYVGGSFKQNVHNVLEPAVYQIPVMFGPVNRNSHEAQLLKASGGGIEVSQSEELRTTIEKFIINDVYRQETGLKAYRVVEENRGATKRTVEGILSII